MPSLDTLSHSLPEGFPFYHLGEITRTNERRAGSSTEIDFAGRAAVGISLVGDLRALLLVLIEEGLDLSIYSEVANIFASQLSTRLSQQGVDVLISAPSVVSRARLGDLITQTLPMISHRYLHLHDGLTIAVDAILMLEAPSGEAGHA